ncbi:hypothetical protein D6D04_04621 [Aureobasidium pullulans]|nr:hypothetical protein D6D04_04621 [Aureobasidium pullulans]
MENCSTYHSNQITELGRQFGVYLLYLPPYLPHLNPIEQTFHLLKQWLRRWRDLAPTPEGMELADYKAAWIKRLEGAVTWALNDVNISNLFGRSQVPSIELIRARV